MFNDHSEFSQLARLFRRQADWSLCPYGEWVENDRSRVIFDRHYRPICRIKVGGKVEIVPTDEFIQFQEQKWFHEGFGGGPKPSVRKIVVDIIERHQLAPALRRRFELRRSGGELPRWNG